MCIRIYIHMCTVYVLHVYRFIPHSSGNSYIRIMAFVNDHHVVVHYHYTHTPATDGLVNVA